jgi:hypothetical protein
MSYVNTCCVATANNGAEIPVICPDSCMEQVPKTCARIYGPGSTNSGTGDFIAPID